jgi:pimeloyl-ACP methyl ester carboxylesterase
MTHSSLTEIRPGRKIRIIHYKNPSFKTIFFIHGLGGRADQLREQIEFFKPDYNIVALDMLGHGESEKPETSYSLYSFAELSADIQMIFDQYATDVNYLVGHSYGGAFATYLTLKNIKRINKLILIAPSPLRSKLHIIKIFYLPVSILEFLRPYFTKTFAKLMFNPQTDTQLIAKELAITSKNPMYVIKSLVLGLKNIPEEDVSKIKQPTLIITGATDGLIPYRAIYNFYKRIPNVTFETIKNSSHLVILEQPEIVNQMIKNFID